MYVCMYVCMAHEEFAAGVFVGVVVAVQAIRLVLIEPVVEALLARIRKI